jgi:Domain of unknown function (DUF4365)
MAEMGLLPRKRRTRAHVIADQSINYVERFFLDEGHTAQRLTPDYGFDLILFTFDEFGHAEPEVAFLQVKASERLTPARDYYAYDLDVRDYHLWMIEDNPVFLVLYDAARRRAYWVHVQGYFREVPGRAPKKGAKTVRVLVPIRQPISRRGVAKMRELKRKADIRIATGGGR